MSKKGEKPIMKKKSVFVIVIIFFIFFCHSSFAGTQEQDFIYLKNGDVIKGEIIKLNTNNVIVKTDTGIKTFNFKDVYTISKDKINKSSYELIKAKNGKVKNDFTNLVQMHTWAIGPEISHIKYKEPGLMEQKGFMYGLNSFYAYHNNFMLKTDIRYSHGEVDYKSNGTGKQNNIDDYIFEVRGLAGYDFKLSCKEFITPYIGVGYRYLNDDSSGKQTSTGHWGYERESFYYYIPIGFEAFRRLNGRWSVTVKLEYDYFFDGEQKSRLSDIDSGFNNIKNDQDDGYGIRGSIKILYDYSYVKISFEPFVNYWSIDESNLETLFRDGVPIGYDLYEPDNRSTKIGIRVIFEY